MPINMNSNFDRFKHHAQFAQPGGYFSNTVADNGSLKKN